MAVPIIAKHFFSRIEQLEIGHDGEALIRARLRLPPWDYLAWDLELPDEKKAV
jgi:hypothetical protein